ncbi:hypothetical protein H1W37_19480 [Stappia taiwanensis]|uniref:Phage tail protein n=1 Tax=Stappia taiwanensis TaxID=992267 RepID=A0A838XTT5_9HYPH|nr:hypothetical protein [Stappia taiwanensis]MBA4613845.1 hypothetical protein [Stappia taiwanensis]GGE79094.1 hypothetical protein GCM10007285_03630 [Stappia taiwanensis]
MVTQSGPQKSSCNAGEFSEDLYGKVGMRQYYSAGKRFKNVEPVPQSGFRLMPGTAHVAVARSASVRHFTLPVSARVSYTLIFSAGWCDIFRNDRQAVASIALPEITAALLPELEFYGEAATVGIFHEDLETIRLLRDSADDTVWTKDLWPYDRIPKVDLGDVYPKTDDVWDIALRWAGSTASFVLSVSVNGEETKGLPLVDAMGDPIAPDASTAAHYDLLATALQAELRSLPSLSDGVTVAQDETQAASRYRVLRITFGADLAGAEYQVDARIVNTAEASALSFHREIGETDGEPIVSDERGWFAGMGLYQDRAIYLTPKARQAALAMSEVGEYFRLNIEASGDNAARLEALRTQTSQRILAIFEDKYLLVFTDQGEWFASNRTIKQGEPLNWVRTSSNGIQPHVPPVEMEGRVFYVSGNDRPDGDRSQGQVLYSANYDDVSTRYSSKPESLLASHLVNELDMDALQKKVRKNDAARWWLKSSTGRLICALVVLDQEILALVEWVAADAGKVTGLSVDGQNRVWLTVDRGGTVTHEIMEEQETNLFQGAITGTTDLAGKMSGLDLWEGRTVWAEADGYILGPFVVTAGAIDLESPFAEVRAGLWQPPVHESMGYHKLLPNDEILLRPGRIHSVTINIIDTDSLAVGANGGAPKPVDLLTTADPAGAPPPAKTKPVRVTGMPGMTVAPTLVITQNRPGRLRVRDYTVEAAL